MEQTKKQRVKLYGEVFTPQWVVDRMCDDLERESPGAFAPDATFLEPSCGEGVFVCEILRRKFRQCRTRADYTRALRSVYAFDILPDNVEATIRNVTAMCGEFFSPSRKEQAIIRDHVIQADALKVMRMWQDPAVNETIRKGCDDG